MSDRATLETELALSGPAVGLPSRLGPYAVEGILGQGGMGIVYRARSDAGAPVAIKAIRPELASSAVLDRFEREGGIRIEHPNVIRTLDAGWDASSGTPWIAFELLEGESLDHVFRRRGPVPASELVPWLEAICAGVGAAHAHGIVHRDLKPANVFVCSDGRVKVLDFGIALVTHAARVTVEAQVIGTLAYLSPEQARGERDLDARTDVWAIGALAYEALSGRLPFEKRAPVAMLLAIVQDEPAPLRQLLPDAPRPVLDAVMRCLEKPRELRFESAAALARALSAPDTASARPVRSSPSLRPGESRAVVLLLAREVDSPDELVRAIEEAGGAPIVLLGNEVVGIFGARAWRGDEARRAVTTAIALRHLARRMSVCAGRAQGAVAGVGGEALAAAERGCGLGLEGVAIDHEVAEALGAGFVVEPATEGFGEALGEREDVDDEVDARIATFVGRESELAAAEETLSTWSRGRAAALVLEGPTGSGKTRLRREIERRALVRVPSAVILSAAGQAAPGEAELEGAAFGFFASALRARTRWGARERGWPMLRAEAAPLVQRQAVLALAREAITDRAAAARCAEFLGQLLGVSFGAGPELALARRDPELMADRLRGAIHDYVEGLLTKGPVVIAIDDLQWLDRPSRQLVHQLARQFADHPLLVVGARRARAGDEGGAGLAEARVIPVGPLTPADVRTLAEHIAGGPIDARVARLVAQRTDGNPLFVEHVVAALKARGALGAAPSSETAIDRLPVPFTVEAAIQARFDELDDATREACRLGSVYGRPFSAVELLALGVTQPEAALVALTSAGILEPGGASTSAGDVVYAFKSELFATTAYRSVAKEARAELHRRAAMHLDVRRGRDPEEVAIHYERGLSALLAAARFAEAALEAATSADGARVLRCAERALSLGAPEALLFDLHLARADAFRFSRRRAEQAEALAEAFTHARTALERARVLRDQSLLAAHRGLRADAAALSLRAIEEATSARDPEAMAVAYARAAEVALRAGEIADATTAVAHARALAPRCPPVPRGHVAAATAALAVAMGDVGTAVDEYAEAARLHAKGGDVRRAAGAAANLADQYNRIGAYVEAERRLREVLDECRRVGNRLPEGYALANLGYALAWQSRAGDAIAVLDAAERAAHEVGDARLALTVRLYRARAEWMAGRGDDALAHAVQIAESAHAGGDRALASQAEALGARVALGLGRVAPALELSARALATHDDLGEVGEDEAEIFVARAEALTADGATSEGDTVRARGVRRVEHLAERIADPEWRERFRTGPALHRALGLRRA